LWVTYNTQQGVASMAKKDKKEGKGHEEIPLSKQEQKDLDDVWKKLREQHKKK